MSKDDNKKPSKPTPDTRTTLQRVNATLDVMEGMLDEMVKNQNKSIDVETNRVSYKEGLVDGLCMMSWEKLVEDDDGSTSKKDFVGGDEGKLLSDVLEEIGSVYGFDGEAELLRVKCTDDDGEVKPELREVKDEDVEVVDMETEDKKIGDKDVDGEPMGEDEMI